MPRVRVIILVVVGLILVGISPIGALVRIFAEPRIRALAGPPSDAMPNAVQEIDAKGVLTWWGCMALEEGDAREVGSYGRRALLFVPDGNCEIRNPVPRTDVDHIYLTWRIRLEEEPFGGLWLLSASACPREVSPDARRKAERLVRDFLERSVAGNGTLAMRARLCLNLKDWRGQFP